MGGKDGTSDEEEGGGGEEEEEEQEGGVMGRDEGEEQGVQGETIVVQRSGTLICSRTSLTCRCTRTI